MFLTTRLGMTFTHAAPKPYQAPEAWQALARANCQNSTGRLIISDDPVASVQDADFIYTDLWWWIGQEDEIPDRRAAFMPDYQVNDTLLKAAPSHARVMHCLPASRGVEATDAVLDGPQSIIFDQAENRLHMEKGLLAWFIYPRLIRPSADIRAREEKTITHFITTQAPSLGGAHSA
jgi:putrescine carbamoyltransferase